MRVLVCGGRTFGYTPESNFTKKDFNIFNKAVDLVSSYKPTAIIQGLAKGGAEVGKLTAEALDIPDLAFCADWDKYGYGAVHIRNQQMLAEGKPDLVIAFVGGKGTASIVERSLKAGVVVVRVSEEDL